MYNHRIYPADMSWIIQSLSCEQRRNVWPPRPSRRLDRTWWPGRRWCSPPCPWVGESKLTKTPPSTRSRSWISYRLP
uniref:Uncharacterized protein n=1 Tax=Triticum urartu TaxID=4572 RepID=A0A8R7UKI8_TRIUA